MQLTTEQNSPSEEYLSDYAYVDTSRLAYYYGQLSENGLVTQSKHTSKTTGKDTGKLEVKAVMVSGLGQVETSSERSIELQVDPSYTRPQETLDALYTAGFVGSGLSNARIGNLVLTKGHLSIFDIRMLKEMWMHIAGITAQQETANIASPKDRQKAFEARKKEAQSTAEIISKVPHSVQGTCVTDQGDAWFTLQTEYMRINAEDLVFKHGCDLEGEWHVLGIVDALPDNMTEPSPGQSHVTSELEVGLRMMLAAIRNALGRPPHRYGITPLLIFRTMRKV
jgi:hypothetical protein